MIQEIDVEMIKSLSLSDKVSYIKSNHSNLDFNIIQLSFSWFDNEKLRNNAIEKITKYSKNSFNATMTYNRYCNIVRKSDSKFDWIVYYKIKGIAYCRKCTEVKVSRYEPKMWKQLFVSCHDLPIIIYVIVN